MKNVPLSALQTMVIALVIGVVTSYAGDIVHDLSGVNLAPHIPAPSIASSVVGVIYGFVTSLLVMRWSISPFWSGVRIATVLCAVRLVETVITFTVGGRVLIEEWNLPVVSFSIDILLGLTLGYAIRVVHLRFEMAKPTS